MLRSARAELDLYDRNRETLFDLGDADLRARIQTLIIRLSMPLDGVIEATEEIKAMREVLRTIRDAEERSEIETRLATSENRREAGYEFIVENAQRLKDVIAGLEPHARTRFDRIDRVVNAQ